MTNEASSNEISLSVFWEVFKKRVIFLVLAFALCLGLAMIYRSSTYVPVYSSTVSVYVHNDSTMSSDEENESAADRFNNLKFSEALMDDFRIIIQSRGVLTKASEHLGYEVKPSMVSVQRASDDEYSHILYITASATDPQKAKDIAETVYLFGNEQIRESTQTNAMNVFDGAVVPTAPGNSRYGYGVVLAGLVGAIAVYVLFLFLYMYQERITTAEDIEKKLGIVCLGNIPNENNIEKHGRSYKHRYYKYAVGDGKEA